MIRTVWVMVAGFFLTLFYGSWAVLASYFRPEGFHCLCERLGRNWSRSILRVSGVRVRVEGSERLTRDCPQILVSNHQSWFDVFALAGHLPIRYRFVAKEELGRIPIFGRAWKGCGHISIDRGDRSAAISSLERASERIREQGMTIILFAEGTRSPTGELLPFKKGAFVLAIQTQEPILPVAITGSRAVMPKGGWRVRPGEICVRIGDPIPVKGLTMRDRDALLRTTRERIQGLLDGGDAEESRPSGEGEAVPAPTAD